MGYYCRIVVLVVGFLGSVHTKFVSGPKLCDVLTPWTIVKLCDVPVGKARAAAKCCSISTMTGLKLIWKMRCREMAQAL